MRQFADFAAQFAVFVVKLHPNTYHLTPQKNFSHFFLDSKSPFVAYGKRRKKMINIGDIDAYHRLERTFDAGYG